MIIYPPHSPIAVGIGSISLHWYGILIALAILLSYILAERQAKDNNIEIGKFEGIFLATVISGITGARLAFAIQDLTYYSSHLKEVFYIFDGGLSIHGALILGSLGLFYSSKYYKVDFKKLANTITPYVLLSGAIGRWGNFFNQEIIGKPSNFFIKLFVSAPNRPLGYSSTEFFHPVFFYESVLLFLAFIIYLIFKKRLNKNAFVYTLITYSIIRICVEFFRIDYKPIFLSLDLAQIVSFAIIIITVGLFLVPLVTKNAAAMNSHK